jgi:lysozyme
VARRNVPNDPAALPPVLDLEWNGHSRTCPKKLPRETALEKIQLMLKEMQAHTGKRPIIYTDITFHKEVLEGELSEYPHWVRSVAAEPHERYQNRQWMMWQYTTTGRVPGINTTASPRRACATESDEAQGRPAWEALAEADLDRVEAQELPSARG